MDQFHREILKEIKQHSGHGTKHSWDANYLGNSDIHYNISNLLKRQIAKNFIKNHKDLTLDEFLKLLDSLYNGDSYEEKTIAGYLLYHLPNLRKKLSPVLLDKWLSNITGWAEIDSTCQSNFTAKEMLVKWEKWRTLIDRLCRNGNINKRRAGLVLLTKGVRGSRDKRLSNLAFHSIERLKSEKDILITKAISWLLRDLIVNHRREVEEYLNENLTNLPKIVVREVIRKLETGKK